MNTQRILNTKEQILELLEKNRGRSTSGEFLAKQLNISRNAVWKAVKELEKEGYKIEAATNKGYCLQADNDIISVQGIAPFLSQSINAPDINIFSALDSTNKKAKEMAVNGAGHGTVVIADHQTDGKGRFNRRFFSPPNCGIYMSIVLRPKQSDLTAPALTTALAAVTVCEAIEAVAQKTPQIKWVNDIFLDNKKICGISTEAVTDFESGNIEWIVVGIGINFNEPQTSFPDELRNTAGSIFPGGQQTATRNQLIAEILNRYLSDNPAGKAEVLEKYKQRLLMLNKKVTVFAGNESYEAFVIDIDGSGRLIVRKDSGETICLCAGEISIKEIGTKI